MRNALSRRDMLRLGGALTAGAGASLVGGTLLAETRAKPVGDKDYIPGRARETIGFGIRKNAHSLSSDSDDVRMYRDAVGWMKARSVKNPLDPMGWAQHWAHHSLFCATNTFEYQVHYGWNFLPWHRAYLVNLEQKIRHLLNEPGFALPYWDWTNHPTIPEWYFGDDNPLNNTTRLQEPGDVIPADFLEVGPSLRARRWEHFGGRERIPGNIQVEGTLEQSVHNCVHNWIGGEMASFDGAGNDPIFQSQHGQIDRLWESWLAQGERTNPDRAAWLDHPFWFYGVDGEIESYLVRDLGDTEALGYRYDSLAYRHTLTDKTTPELDGAGTRFGDLKPDASTLARLEGVASGNDYARVALNYERMSLPMHPFHHRLFFQDVVSGDAVYAGTFTILPIPDRSQGLERIVTSQVEVPAPALENLLKNGHVRVIGQPVPLKGRAIPEQPVPFQGVSLTIES